MNIVILSGIQAAGKSTLYANRFADSHKLLSLDALRSRLEEHRVMTELIELREPFVVDNTNPTPEVRAKYITAAKAAGYRVIGYQIEVPVRIAIARNRQRGGTIPDAAIWATAKKMLPLSYEEGFDEIIRIAE